MREINSLSELLNQVVNEVTESDVAQAQLSVQEGKKAQAIAAPLRMIAMNSK